MKEVLNVVDWTKSMEQSFEYHIVDPNTWTDKSQLHQVTSCTINRDSSADTLGSATINTTETIDECYVRIYLITIQNGVREKHPLGTFLVQTSPLSFNGRTKQVSMDAYTPLIELKENKPPIGYSLLKNEPIMDTAYQLCVENLRAPVVRATSSETLYSDFVADPSEYWMTFLRDLIGNAKFKFDLDEMGRVLFAPSQSTASLQPVWTYNDDNSSILYPEIEEEHDLYGIPNVVEVLYSTGEDEYFVRVVNDDPNSSTSTVARGREILHRVENPSNLGDATERQVKEYAERTLSELSTLEYTITYTHGYNPVRVGDGVRLNYTKAGINDVKAKVIHQSIKCEAGCPITEKAVYTKKLWR